MTASTVPIVSAVTEKVQQITQSDAFKKWAEEETLRAGDLVLLNNSFLFREGIRTTKKSSLYLGLDVSDDGVSLPPKIVASRSNINVSFKRVAARTASTYVSTDLKTAVEREIENLGEIVFALAGTVGDREAVTVALSSVAQFEVLRFDPTQTEPVVFDESTLSVRQLEEIDELWTAILERAESEGIDLGVDAASGFDKAFTELQEEAGRPVHIGTVTKDGPSILTEVLSRVDEQIADFKTALDDHVRDGSPDTLSEVLRIAYNFADGARALLTLVVGLSDLKPVLFWLTVLEQAHLAEQFAQLPFALVGKAKPSLDRYRAVIAAARNRAFHDLFAFGSPFQVRLTGEAFRTPELRLFREHSRRREPALEYEDRKLVDLLEEFTRAQERPVPAGFWEQNYLVMGAVADVGRALLDGLVLAHESRAGR